MAKQKPKIKFTPTLGIGLLFQHAEQVRNPHVRLILTQKIQETAWWLNHPDIDLEPPKPKTEATT